LGANLTLELRKQHPVHAAVHSRQLRQVQFSVHQADLTNLDELDRLIAESSPDGVINCAGLTKIDQCVKEPARAQRLNTWLPKKLAGITHKRDIRLVHVSTATVFDGRKGSYRETDSPNPLSHYARTKFEGETAVLEQNPEAVIARVSMFGWSPSGKRSLAEFFYSHLRQGMRVPGFTDAVFSPLLVNHLAGIFQSLLTEDIQGLFHVGGSDAVSKYEFGRMIARKFEFDPEDVVPARIKDHPFAGKRSPNVSMDNTKLMEALDREPIKLSTGLDQLYRLYQQGYPQELRNLAVNNLD